MNPTIPEIPFSIELEAAAAANGLLKDVIRVGKFKHPGTGKQFEVDKGRLDKWVANFDRMKAAGINVPIYDGHKGKALGHISHAEVGTDGRLYMRHEFADPEAEKLARRNKFCSVRIEPNYEDAEGNKFNDVIEHVAVTAEPVITRQNDYINLSRDDDSDTNDKDDTIMLEKMRELLEMPDADEAAISARVTELKKVPAAAPVKLSKDTSDAFKELSEGKIDDLVGKGILNPKASDALKLALVGTEEKPNDFCLSRSISGTENSVISDVVDALLLNKEAVKPGEESGAQIPEGTVNLSKDTDANDAKAVELAKTEAKDMQTRMVTTANRNRPEPATQGA